MKLTFVKRNYPYILILILVVLLVPAGLNLFNLIPKAFLIDERVHSSIEAAGAMLSILITVLLYNRYHDIKEELVYPFIALGFLGMGIFDLLHSFQKQGDAFVFTHVVSILSGGIWFGALALPSQWRKKIRNPFVFGGIIMVWLILIAWVEILPQYLPTMVEEGNFTFLTDFLNGFAFLFFFAGVAALIVLYRKSGEMEIFLIAVVGLIQGASRLTFHSSELWNVDWWLWHFFRLLGSGIIFFSVIRIFSHLVKGLKQKNKNQQEILNAMPFGVFLVNKNKKILQINKAAKEITGFSDYDTLGKNCYESVCMSDCDKCPVLDLGNEVRNEERLMSKKDGSAFPVIKSVIPIQFDEEEVLLEGFIDISMLKQTEEELKLSEKKFREIFDSVTSSIFVVDFERGIVDVNKTATKQYGYSKEEFLKMSPPDFIHPDYLSEFDRFIKELKEKGNFSGETIELKKDGSGFYSSVSGTIVTFNGKPHMLGLVQDVSEMKEAEQKIKNSLSDLERSNKELEQFAYVSSHDLQEPLRKIKNYAQLLEFHYKDKLEEKGKNIIDILVRSTARMQKLIEDLLDISRISTRGESMNNVDFNQVIRKVEEKLRNKIKKENAIIEISKLPVARADVAQMEELFYHLLSNSLKYRSERTPHIKITCKTLKDKFEFTISDNGIGFEMQYAERIFVIFQRLHGRNEYSGTGVGLAIAKKIIERHGGKIWAHSSPGEGADFTFTISRILTSD